MYSGFLRRTVRRFHLPLPLGFLCACAQSRPTLCDPTDCGPPGSSAHGILQARPLEWGALFSSRASVPTWGLNPRLLCLLSLQADSSPLSQSVQSLSGGSVRPHGLQHTRLPCPPPSPAACSHACPSSQWCHPTSHPLSLPLDVIKSASKSVPFKVQISRGQETGGGFISVVHFFKVLSQGQMCLGF